MRASGKTFRLLLGCLAEASLGNWVIYVSPYPTEYAQKMARIICSCIQNITYKAKVIYFPNEGKLEFCTEVEYLQRIKDCKFYGLQNKPLVHKDAR